MRNKLLIVVHLGSLCGSANFNLGEVDAEKHRTAITQEIATWPGAIAVISGEHDIELDLPPFSPLAAALSQKSFSTYGASLEGALRRAAIRVVDHYDYPLTDPILVTGAWNDHDGTGCVNTVVNALKIRGFTVSTSINSPASDIPTNSTALPVPKPKIVPIDPATRLVKTDEPHRGAAIR